MRSIYQQLFRLQAFVMAAYNGEQPSDATVRVCVLCGAEARVPHPCADVSAEVAKTVHDPSCLYNMLRKATLWVAGSNYWESPTEEMGGFRFFPATTLSAAATAMARRVSSYEAWTDEDGTAYPDGRRLFMALNIPLFPEFEEAYEFEKRAGELRARWEREMESRKRLRDHAFKVLNGLNLDESMAEQMRKKVEEAYPFIPPPVGKDE